MFYDFRFFAWVKFGRLNLSLLKNNECKIVLKLFYDNFTCSAFCSVVGIACKLGCSSKGSFFG